MIISSEVRPSHFVLQPIVKGSYREVLFNVYDSPSLQTLYDLDATSITLEVLPSRDGIALITKKNTAAGGGDTEIKIESGNNSFTLFLEETDTDITFGEYIVIISIVKSSKTIKSIGTLSII